MRVSVFLLIILISACSREPLNGTVYVIKGDGSITRAASVEVRALPFASIDEFLTARTEWYQTTDRQKLSDYKANFCGALPSETDKLIKQKSPEMQRFSAECVEEKMTVGSLNEQGLAPNSISLLIDRKERERSKVIERVAREFKVDLDSKVKISVDYSDDSYGLVYVKNTSDYWIVNDDYVYAFQSGFPACEIRKSPVIAPGEVWQQSLRKCYFTNDTSEMRERKDVKICRDSGLNATYSKSLCYDDFGRRMQDYGSQWNFKKAPWQFSVDGTLASNLDFKQLAMASEEVQSLNDELSRLKEQLTLSTNAEKDLADCGNLQEQLIDLRSLECPSEELTRDQLESYLVHANSLDVGVDDLPTRSLVRSEEFAVLNAFETLTTNVDSAFTINSPPSSDFLVYAKYRDNFNTLEWLVPIGADVTSIELNNSNAR